MVFVPDVNFHGLTLPVRLPQIDTVEGGVWSARADIASCPGLELVLPARKEAVETPFLEEMREAARLAVYRAMAQADPAPRLAWTDWHKAKEAGIEMPEPPTELRLWRPAIADTDYWDERSAFTAAGSDALVMQADPEPPEAQALHRALGLTGLQGGSERTLRLFAPEVPRGGNPCRAVAKYRTRRLERFLTEEEFRRLGQVLDTLEAEGRLPVHAAAALRLLMLTGCRCGEITTLRWEDVDLEAKEIRLRDSKTGPRVVPLSPGAARVLAGLPRDAGNPWVIAGRKPDSRLSHIVYYWYRVRERAELDDVRIHDLRHSFASRALALGESLPTIGKLLGHSKIQTTARYAHLARDSVQESAARVAASIGADLLP